MVECGHGGICYTCAIEAIKSRGQCMECRREIQHVAKIDPAPKFKNIIKAYETTKIILPKVQDQPQENVD